MPVIVVVSELDVFGFKIEDEKIKALVESADAASVRPPLALQCFC
jgi:hypothetical protein